MSHLKTIDEKHCITRRPLNWKDVRPPRIVLAQANKYEGTTVFDGFQHQVPDIDVGPF